MAKEIKGFTQGFSAKSDCGCEILIFPTSGYSFKWCPLHKSALKIYETLKLTKKLLDKPYSEAWHIIPNPISDMETTLGDIINSVLAEAEKET